MKPGAALDSSRRIFLPGLALVALAVVLGVALSAAVLAVEQQRRAVYRADAAPAAVPPPAEDTLTASPGRTAASAAPIVLPSPAPTRAASPSPPLDATTPAPGAAPTAVVLAAPTEAPASAPPAGTSTVAPRAASPTAGTSAGGAIFASACGACHPNGEAGLGPRLRGLSAETIARVTREGKGAMPAFDPGRLSDQQLRDITAFLSATN